MAVVENRFVCDLSKPVQAQALKGNVFSLDNLGSRLSVLIYNNGQPATISGSVTANCILPDGSTVNVNGGLTTENGNSKAYVDIPQSCLLIPGILKIAIKCKSSSVITTLAAIVANVYMTKTDNVITPSQQIINDWNAEISAAIATQNAAIANQDTKINDLKSALSEHTDNLIPEYKQKQWTLSDSVVITADGCRLVINGTKNASAGAATLTELFTLAAGTYTIGVAESLAETGARVEVRNSSSETIVYTTTSESFTLDADTSVLIRIYISASKSFSGLVVAPMLFKGSLPSTYIPQISAVDYVLRNEYERVETIISDMFKYRTSPELDLNEYKENGWYALSNNSSYTNAPSQIAGKLAYLLAYAISSYHIIQIIALPYDGNIFVRKASGNPSEWSDWKYKGKEAEDLAVEVDGIQKDVSLTTETTKNLIPEYNNSRWELNTSIVITTDGNVLNVNGTKNASEGASAITGVFELQAGTYYLGTTEDLTGKGIKLQLRNGTNTSTIITSQNVQSVTFNETTSVLLRILVSANTVANNVKIYPMIFKDSFPKSFIPRFSAVDFVSRNMIAEFKPVDDDLYAPKTLDTHSHTVAHRGVPHYSPGGTKPSYVMAKEMGLLIAEGDVRFTSDNVAVLFHNSTYTVDGVTHTVANETYAQLMEYDIGAAFSEEYTGTYALKLSEFLDLCNDLQMIPTIEFKTGTTEQINACLAMIDAKRVKVFNYKASVENLKTIIDHDPYASVRLGQDNYSSAFLANLTEIVNYGEKKHTTHFIYATYGTWTAEDIAACKATGAIVGVSEINSNEALKALTEDVDIIFTGYGFNATMYKTINAMNDE